MSEAIVKAEPKIDEKTPASSAGLLMNFLEKRKADIGLACAKHVNPDRLLKIMGQIYSRTPAIAECTVLSIYVALLHAAETGLEPGPLGHSAIVPYRNKQTGRMEAQFQAMYRGLLKLARNSGEVGAVHCDVVHEGDEFAYWTDEKGRHLKHVPNPDVPEDAAVRYAYMVGQLRDGTPQIEVMTYRQLEGIRKRAKSASSGPWVTDTEEMYRKTVFKRGSKWLPVSEELHRAVAIDNETEAEKPAEGSWRSPLALPEAPVRIEDAIRVAASQGVVSVGATAADDEPVEVAAEPAPVDSFGELYRTLEPEERKGLWAARFGEVADVKALEVERALLDRHEPAAGDVRGEALVEYTAAKKRLGKK